MRNERRKAEVYRAFDKSIIIALKNKDIDERTLGMNVLMLSRKLNVRFDRSRSIFICRKCGSILIPGRTGRYRIHSKGKIAYLGIKCLVCGWYR
ncbi:MAG: ribonuclease P Rpr2/Rpp21/SNM1 subunit, partial [Fervidicoccaceae archaeon]